MTPISPRDAAPASDPSTLAPNAGRDEAASSASSKSSTPTAPATGSLTGADPARQMRDARAIIDGQVDALPAMPDSLAGGSSRSPGADALAQVRRDMGLEGPMPGMKDGAAGMAVDVAGAAAHDSVQQMRGQGSQDFLANNGLGQPFGVGTATGRQSSDPAPAEDAEPAADAPAAAEPSAWESVKNWFISVVGTAATNPNAKGFTSNAVGGVAGVAGGILTANGTVEDKTNEANGIFAVFRQGAVGVGNVNEANQLDQVDGWNETQDPNADVQGNAFTKKAISQATAWLPTQPAAPTPQDMTGQPAEPGAGTPIGSDLKDVLERHQAAPMADPSHNWAINPGDTVPEGDAPVQQPDGPSYTPPQKDPADPEMGGTTPTKPPAPPTV